MGLHTNMLRTISLLALVASTSAGYALVREFHDTSCTASLAKPDTYYISTTAGACYPVSNDNAGSLKVSTTSVRAYASADCSGSPLVTITTANACDATFKASVVNFDTTLPAATATTSYFTNTQYVNVAIVSDSHTTSGTAKTYSLASTQCSGTASSVEFTEVGRCYIDGSSGTTSAKTASATSSATTTYYNSGNCSGTATETDTYTLNTCVFSYSGVKDTKSYPQSSTYSVLTAVTSDAVTTAPTIAALGLTVLAFFQ